MYTKPVYWLIMKGMYIDKTSRNAHGRNISRLGSMKCIQNMLSVHKTSLEAALDGQMLHVFDCVSVCVAVLVSYTLSQ